MIWSKDALLSKAKLFFGKASSEDRDSVFFGLYNALGLELLARSALANINPVLLADDMGSSMIYALGLKDEVEKKKSIATKKVVDLCAELIPDFDKDLQEIVMLMLERRNEELHSGGGGFAEYNIDVWLASFYKACEVLGISVGETLETLFGINAAKEAHEIIMQDSEKIKKQVLDKIKSREKTYKEDLANRPAEIQSLITGSKRIIASMVHNGYHIVDCPCCHNKALIYGKESMVGREVIEDDQVVVRRDVTANSFQCDVCKLRLNSYAELKCADLPLHYTNTYRYSPIDYFDIDAEYINAINYLEEYSNE